MKKKILKLSKPEDSIVSFELPDMDALMKETGTSLFKPGLPNMRDFEYLCDLQSKKSNEIIASPIGIGYETLDRDTFDPKPTYSHMSSSGVKWARVQTGWNKTEKEKGKYDFDWLDSIVDNLLSVGITPWFSVSFGNGLYTTAKKHLASYVGEVPLYYGDKAVLGWRNYTKALAKHFKGRIKYWEIWNEPNTGFWRPKPNPIDYTELVKISREEIIRIIPDAKIIGGALSGCDVNYLYDALKAGLGEYIDILTIHPYALTPELSLAQELSMVRKLLGQFGCKASLWQGECGRPSARSSWIVNHKGFRLTEYTQAKYLLRRIILDLGLGFEMTSYFSASDFHNYGHEGRTHHQGVLTSGGECRPKLSYYTLQGLTPLFESGTKRVEHMVKIIPLNVSQSSLPCAATRCFTFERNGIPIFAYWVAENMDIEFSHLCVHMLTWLNPGAIPLTDPVIIDPLRRKVYKLPFINYPAHRQIDFHVPLYDYPLFISDIKILGDYKKDKHVNMVRQKV
jgi:hypothetical protein